MLAAGLLSVMMGTYTLIASTSHAETILINTRMSLRQKHVRPVRSRATNVEHSQTTAARQ